MTEIIEVARKYIEDFIEGVKCDTKCPGCDNWCHEHGGKRYKYCRPYYEGEKFILAGVAMAQKWNVLKDELPELFVPILIRDENGYVYTGCCIENKAIMTASPKGEQFEVLNAVAWRYIELK
jgi:hypothetical protein